MVNLVKPRWLREQAKKLKREFRVEPPSDFQIDWTKVTRIELEPEEEAKTLLQRILRKFGRK